MRSIKLTFSDGRTMLFRSAKETYEYLGIGDQKFYKHIAGGQSMETEIGLCKAEYDDDGNPQPLPIPKKRERNLNFSYIAPEKEIADMPILATWEDGTQVFFPVLSKAANYFMVAPGYLKAIAEKGGAIRSKEMGTVYIEEAL